MKKKPGRIKRYEARIVLSVQSPDLFHPQSDPANGAGDDFKGDRNDGTGKGGGLSEGLTVGFNGADMGLDERPGC